MKQDYETPIKMFWDKLSAHNFIITDYYLFTKNKRKKKKIVKWMNSNNFFYSIYKQAYAYKKYIE